MIVGRKRRSRFAPNYAPIGAMRFAFAPYDPGPGACASVTAVVSCTSRGDAHHEPVLAQVVVRAQARIGATVGEWAGEDFPLRIRIPAIAQGHHCLDDVRARGARRAYRAVRRALGEKRYLRRGRLLLHRAAPLSEGRRETC